MQKTLARDLEGQMLQPSGYCVPKLALSSPADQECKISNQHMRPPSTKRESEQNFSSLQNSKLWNDGATLPWHLASDCLPNLVILNISFASYNLQLRSIMREPQWDFSFMSKNPLNLYKLLATEDII